GDALDLPRAAGRGAPAAPRQRRVAVWIGGTRRHVRRHLQHARSESPGASRAPEPDGRLGPGADGRRLGARAGRAPAPARRRPVSEDGAGGLEPLVEVPRSLVPGVPIERAPIDWTRLPRVPRTIPRGIWLGLLFKHPRTARWK